MDSKETHDITITITGRDGAGKTSLARMLTAAFASVGYQGAYFEANHTEGVLELVPGLDGDSMEDLHVEAESFSSIDHSDRYVTVIVGETLGDILGALSADVQGDDDVVEGCAITDSEGGDHD